MESFSKKLNQRLKNEKPITRPSKLTEKQMEEKHKRDKNKVNISKFGTEKK